MLHVSRKAWPVAGALCLCAGIFVPLWLLGDADLSPDERLAVVRSGPDAATTELLAPTPETADAAHCRSRDATAACAATSPNADESARRLADIRDDLAFFANESLHGVLHLNAVLGHVSTLAALPVSARPDFDYEDDDSIAYRIEGLPDGMKGHVLIGLQPYTEAGGTYRYLQMNLDMPSIEPEYLDGVFRDGPNVNLSISYDVADPHKPTRLALMLQRRVDLSASRAQGIDAYVGSFTQGAYYWRDLLDPDGTPSANTFGIVNGQPASPRAFPSATPLVGELQLDPELLNEVLGRLQQKLSFVKGE
ncbi:MAG: hypothetical protein L6Q99_17300 [Planctomycetes bacterium]|nr:hypothetical protein [Planctomycetota bacterium]